MWIAGVLNGLVLIAVGAVFLLINFGRLSWSVWSPLARLWPLLLVLIGLGMAGRSRPLRFFKVLIPVVLLGALGYLLWMHSPADDIRVEYFEEPLPVSKALLVTVTVDRARLELLPYYAESLISGELRYPAGDDPPERTFDPGGDEASWKLKFGDSAEGAGRRGERRADIRLPVSSAVRIKIEAHNSTCKVDVEDLEARFVKVSGEKSTVSVTLGGEAEESAVLLDGKGMDIEVLIPEGAGIRLESSSKLNQADFPRSMLRFDGSTYETAGFETSVPRISIYAGGKSIHLKMREY